MVLSALLVLRVSVLTALVLLAPLVSPRSTHPSERGTNTVCPTRRSNAAPSFEATLRLFPYSPEVVAIRDRGSLRWQEDRPKGRTGTASGCLRPDPHHRSLRRSRGGTSGCQACTQSTCDAHPSAKEGGQKANRCMTLHTRSADTRTVLGIVGNSSRHWRMNRLEQVGRRHSCLCQVGDDPETGI